MDEVVQLLLHHWNSISPLRCLKEEDRFVEPELFDYFVDDYIVIFRVPEVNALLLDYYPRNSPHAAMVQPASETECLILVAAGAHVCPSPQNLGKGG